MQVLLSEMQNSCSRCKVFASRVAKPECRTTIFTGRPAVFASRVAKPESRTTIFTGRPDRLLFYYFYFYYFTISFPSGSRQRFFACRAANPTRPPHPSIFQSFFCISDSLFCMSAHVFACRPNVSLDTLDPRRRRGIQPRDGEEAPSEVGPDYGAALGQNVSGHGAEEFAVSRPASGRGSEPASSLRHGSPGPWKWPSGWRKSSIYAGPFDSVSVPLGMKFVY